MAEISCYKVAQGGIYTKDYLWEAAKCCPSWIWWKGMCSSTQLSHIASSILSLPATSAATERSFSTYEMTHTKKRSRLTNERAAKLVYIRHNLKLFSKKDEIQICQAVQSDLEDSSSMENNSLIEL